MHVLLYVLILFASQWLFAEEPLAVYLTWIKSPSTTMVIQWLAPLKEAKQLYYQRVGDSSWKSITPSSSPMPGASFYIYRQELTGLTPETAYHFHIGEEGVVHKFRTLPGILHKPLRFVVGGDVYHNTLAELKNMNQKAASCDPQFALLGGDLAYTYWFVFSLNEDVQRWVELLHAWQEQMVSKEGFLIPIIPAIGNHDTCGWYFGTVESAPGFYALFPMPGTQGYNSLDFGDYMTLLILDTDHTHPIHGAQKQWLRTALQARESMPHKFALYHVPAYPSRRDPLKRINKRIRAHWVPLFEQFGLSAAFENHDHRYKRTYPLINSKIDPRGVLYFGDGGWGTKLAISKRRDRWYLAKTLSCPYVLQVEIETDRRTFKAIDGAGNVFDEFVQLVSRP